MWPEVIYFGLGTLFGPAFALSRKGSPDLKNFDEEYRKEHEFLKNSVSSLSDDVAYLRKKNLVLRHQITEMEKAK